MIARQWNIAFLIIGALVHTAHAADAAGTLQSPLYHGDPLHLLPASVDTVADQLSLFADFDQPTIEGQIPIYLINLSSEDVQVDVQDSNIYAMLEHQDDEGDWHRAQVHRYSWCGNSYYTITLRPGFFIKRLGYQPRSGGVPGQVRFSMYLQSFELVSNSGEGFMLPADVHSAALDRMSVNLGTFDEVAAIVLSSEMPKAGGRLKFSDARSAAIHRLGSGRFDREKSRKLLERVRKKFPGYEHQIRQALEYLQ